MERALLTFRPALSSFRLLACKLPGLQREGARKPMQGRARKTLIAVAMAALVAGATSAQRGAQPNGLDASDAKERWPEFYEAGMLPGRATPEEMFYAIGWDDVFRERNCRDFGRRHWRCTKLSPLPPEECLGSFGHIILDDEPGLWAPALRACKRGRQAAAVFLRCVDHYRRSDRGVDFDACPEEERGPLDDSEPSAAALAALEAAIARQKVALERLGQ